MDTKLFVRRTGGIYTVVDKQFITGSIFWVGSAVTGASDAAGYGLNPDAPFATLDYAMASCTASAGDVIFLLPGHAEALPAATSCVLDIAGVQVVGLGHGSLQPTFTLGTATSALISVTAADCSIENIKVVSGLANMAAGIALAATADGFRLSKCWLADGGTVVLELINMLTIAADCHNVVVEDCRFTGHTAAATGANNSAIVFAGAANNTRLSRNYFNGHWIAAVVDHTAAASADLVIEGNRVINIDTDAGLGMAFHNSCTGIASGNVVANILNTVGGTTGTGLAYFDNRCTNALTASGALQPAVDNWPA